MGVGLSTLTAIVDEMAEKVRDAVAGASLDIQVEPRMILKPITPAVDIYPSDPFRAEDVEAFADLAGGYLVNVRARVAPVDHEANQEVLLRFLDDEDPLCIHGALLEDPTLNGHASSVHLESVSGYVAFPAIDGSTTHLGCLWRMLVIPARS